MEGGSLGLALFAAVAFLGGLLVERLLLGVRPALYFDVGVPLLPRLVPIPEAPEGEGQTATVCWEVVGDLVRFWAPPGKRTAPMGLHGVVQLSRQGSQVVLDVRWAPPWSPLLAAAWFGGLGLSRGEGSLTLPLAAVMIVGILALYRRAALRAAAELRWHWVARDVD